jgi:hypothetical protein
MVDACMGLLTSGKRAEQPAKLPTAREPWAGDHAARHELVARTILWLSACVASGAKLWDTGLNAGAGMSITGKAAMRSGAPAPDCFARAQLLVQLYTALQPRLQREVRPPMVLLTADILQPTAALHLGTLLDSASAAHQVCMLCGCDRNAPVK